MLHFFAFCVTLIIDLVLHTCYIFCFLCYTNNGSCVTHVLHFFKFMARNFNCYTICYTSTHYTIVTHCVMPPRRRITHAQNSTHYTSFYTLYYTEHITHCITQLIVLHNVLCEAAARQKFQRISHYSTHYTFRYTSYYTQRITHHITRCITLLITHIMCYTKCYARPRLARNFNALAITQRITQFVTQLITGSALHN